MADVYIDIATAPNDTLARLADVLELRAADPQQTAMRTRYQAEIDLRPGARVLEVGCGTGPVTRALARLRTDCEVCGLDPSPFFLERARQLASGLDNLCFRQGDACSLPCESGSFDVVVFHTTLCHVPALEQALSEAHRVLRPGGQLVVFDADYSTTTVAIDASDPLQACAAATVNAIVHNPHLVQQLAAQVKRAGFTVRRFTSYGYHGITDPAYMLTIVDRGADALAADARIGADLAGALKREARRRIENDTFFGFLAYASLIALR